MITLRGKLTRTLVERKSPTPIATRSVIIAGGADSSNAGGSGADAPPAPTAVATSQPTQTQQKNIDDASSPYKSSEEYELVEEWVWKGEWAFGNLPDDDDDGMSVGGKKTDAKKEDDANKNNEVTNTDIEARPDAPLLATADNELTNKSTTDSTAPNDMETDPNKNKSGGWLQKITSIITGAPGDEPKANETTTVTTPAALSSIGNDGSADAKNDENPDTAPAISDNATAKTNIKETHDKQKNRNATNDNNVSSNQTIKAMKPRPFSYRWQKPVEAKDIVIPSSLVGVVDEEDGENDATKVSGGERSESTEKKNEGSSHVSDGAAEAGNRGDGSEVATNMDVDREKIETNKKSSSREGDGTGDGTSKSANGGGENAAADAAPLSSSTAAADPSLATDTNNAPSGTAQQAENKNTENTTSTSKPSRTKMKRTFANPPFTDAGKAMSFGTCPQGGKWEGHFENVVPNATASKKKKDRRDNRIREMFYLFFNATPPSDARTTFPDEENDETTTNTNVINDENTNTLRKDRIHVRGMGSNRFGTFEIVGSYQPKAGILHCQRIYVATPSSSETSPRGNGTKTRNRKKRHLDDDATAEDKRARRRKSTWKKRDMDSFEEYSFSGSGGEGVGSLGAVSGPPGSSLASLFANDGDLVDKVKKRARRSNESAGGGKSLPITAPLPQCTAIDRSSAKAGHSKSDSNISIRSYTSDAKAPAAATSTNTPKATQPVASAKSFYSSSKKHKSSPSANKGPIAGSIAPLVKIPTLPTAGDPFLARWRAAHYLYYQRVDPNTVADGQPAGGGDATTSATGGGGGKAPVKVNFVVYEGEMHDSLREGRGICLYNNSTMYEGFWRKNKEHGKGTLMTADRSRIIYQGDWERGRMHGAGTYYYYKETPYGTNYSGKEEGKYTGEFRENQRNGLGLYTLPDGSTYDGEWRENNMNGWGVFRWPGGSVYEGSWKDGRRHGPNGTLIASDGFRYEGAWVNNGMEGRGIATYPNGQIYEGMWVAGRREGRGTIRFTNGAVYEGRFKDDYMEGQGTLKMSHNVVIPKITNDEGDYDSDVMEVDSDGNTDKTKTGSAAKGEESGKNDWMIPIEFQSDMSHIHLKAGFTQIGL